jgi:hypothetical protein
MGLGFNHGTDEDGWSTCCPHWSYGGFQRFRRELAKVEGFDLESMQGFGTGDIHGADPRPLGGRSWDEVATDLKPLLNHSDCDGELTPEECAQVYSRLREILADWDDDFDRQAGLHLAECMLACAAQGTSLEFC